MAAAARIRQLGRCSSLRSTGYRSGRTSLLMVLRGRAQELKGAGEERVKVCRIVVLLMMAATVSTCTSQDPGCAGAGGGSFFCLDYLGTLLQPPRPSKLRPKCLHACLASAGYGLRKASTGASLSSEAWGTRATSARHTASSRSIFRRAGGRHVLMTATRPLRTPSAVLALRAEMAQLPASPVALRTAFQFPTPAPSPVSRHIPTRACQDGIRE